MLQSTVDFWVRLPLRLELLQWGDPVLTLGICVSVHNPEYSLEGLMLKLKLQYFGHWVQRVNSLEKTLMLGNIESKR